MTEVLPEVQAYQGRVAAGIRPGLTAASFRDGTIKAPVVGTVAVTGKGEDDHSPARRLPSGRGSHRAGLDPLTGIALKAVRVVGAVAYGRPTRRAS